MTVPCPSQHRRTRQQIVKCRHRLDPTPQTHGKQPGARLDVSSPVEEDGVLVVQTTATDVGLIALPSGAGTNQIFGNVEVPNDSTGVLVVAETAGDSPQGFTAIADRDG